MAVWALSVPTAAQAAPASWQGTVRDAKGNVVAEAQVELRETGSGRTFSTTTDAQGAFTFPNLPAGNYAVRIRWHNKTTASRELLKIQPGDHLNSSVQVAAAGGWLVLQTAEAGEQAASEWRGKTLQPASFGVAAEQARLQSTAAAGGRHHDGHQRLGEFHPAIRREWPARHHRRLCHGRRGHDRSGTGRRHLYQLQRGRGAGNPVALGRDACGNRPRCRRLHQHQDQGRDESAARLGF